jgi:hypothetical protein
VSRKQRADQTTVLRTAKFANAHELQAQNEAVDVHRGSDVTGLARPLVIDGASPLVAYQLLALRRGHLFGSHPIHPVFRIHQDFTTHRRVSVEQGVAARRLARSAPAVATGTDSFPWGSQFPTLRFPSSHLSDSGVGDGLEGKSLFDKRD